MMILLHILIIAFFVFPSLYYFVFALAGKMWKPEKEEPASGEQIYSRFCIMIPAYKSDGYISPTVQSALDQDYPEDKYRVLVISDGMSDQTDSFLGKAGAEVLKVNFVNSTKAASLKAGMDFLGEGAADYIVILDSDNIVSTSFLRRMSSVLAGRKIALQGHRCAKNADTPIALADGIFEEVNNLVFRAGHCALGLSSALIGSGMAFPYSWFFENAGGFITAGEDKEMELKLLKDGIFVGYAGDIRILDEKTRSVENLQKQRARWLSSQYFLISRAVSEFPGVRLKVGYADKIIQWLFVPRIILFTVLPSVAVVALISGSPFAWLYVLSSVLLYVGIALGLPDGIGIREILSVFSKVPSMIGVTLKNIFSRKHSGDKFIHTVHI